MIHYDTTVKINEREGECVVTEGLIAFVICVLKLQLDLMVITEEVWNTASCEAVRFLTAKLVA